MLFRSKKDTAPPVLVFENKESNGFVELLRCLNTHFSKNPDDATEFEKELDYINNVVARIPISEKLLYSIIPYPFTLEYDLNKIIVHHDEEVDMFYVYLDGKKLYYHRGFSNRTDVQKSFMYVTAEQHPDSPHRYLDEVFSVNANDIVADLGAAEGNFSLMVVDKVKELTIV